MDVLKYKGFYKNNATKRVDEMKAASNRQAKKQRELSRHEIRQTYRNLDDSDEENAAPRELQQSKRCQIGDSKNKIILTADQYRCRLNRLREFRERKRMLEEQKTNQRAPFIPFVGKAQAIESAKSAKKLANGIRKPVRPLDEMQEMREPKPFEAKIKTNGPSVRYVKHRVDCWLTPRDDLVFGGAESSKRPVSANKKQKAQFAEPRPFKPQVVVMSTEKNKETKKPNAKASKNFLRGGAVQQPALPQSALITSTARKPKKPIQFTFNAIPSRSVANKKNQLTVSTADSLFDGISPIELEPSPRKNANVPTQNCQEADSIWEPQPVASINEVTALDGENGLVTANHLSMLVDRDAEGSMRKPALNESFTINDDDYPAHGAAEGSIFGCRPTVGVLPATVVPVIFEQTPTVVQELCSPNSAATNMSMVERRVVHPSPQVLPNKTCSARRRSSIWSITLSSGTDTPSPSVGNKQITKNGSDESQPPSASAMLRKRASVVFIEDTIRSVISPSTANLNNGATNGNTQPKQTSSSSSNAQDDDAQQEASATPQEVLEKTRFYYEKVDREVARLQVMCDEFAPFLDEEQELNDHCKGLILAAQGQTNILINKKLTKFRDLIGHYENKWNDRKVRNDDLDGFWLMLSLDLENLDKRFEELRMLRANGWQEVKPEPPPKVKKLQGGGGIRKREKKTAATGAGKPSSSIASLIRKARQEQLKQKAANIDLGALAETVTLVTTPVKKSVRIAPTPKRASLRRQSSQGTGCTPTITYWKDQEQSPAAKNRRTIFPEIAQRKDSVKSILKTPSLKRRAKSVLFLDSGLDTPQTRSRQNRRTVVDTPKPRIKFNDEVEIEHIDNLVARTPSRLDDELHKRRRQSSLLFCGTDTAERNEEELLMYPQGTPHTKINSSKRRTRRISRNLSAALLNVVSDDVFEPAEQGEEVTKRTTRSSTNKSGKRTVDFS